MLPLPLQAGLPPGHTKYLANIILGCIAVVLATYIIFQAFEGYRRNDSKQMLLLGVALTCLTILPIVASIAGILYVFLEGFNADIHLLYIPGSILLAQIVGLSTLWRSVKLNH
ncbi:MULTISPECIES: hypothetical protein [Halobacterium]|uniref:hypothetical protein n=1 Tax=Halobacterium TaxID=2239 RepID=UPI00073F621E|nr:MULTISPECIES: hypothetical protein [Halobacterium]MCG1002975.1 hypothetical protein [Halobacterium noricense]